jgi:hypothetical protein
MEFPKAKINNLDKAGNESAALRGLQRTGPRELSVHHHDRNKASFSALGEEPRGDFLGQAETGGY